MTAKVKTRKNISLTPEQRRQLWEDGLSYGKIEACKRHNVEYTNHFDVKTLYWFEKHPKEAPISFWDGARPLPRNPVKVEVLRRMGTAEAEGKRAYTPPELHETAEEAIAGELTQRYAAKWAEDTKLINKLQRESRDVAELQRMAIADVSSPTTQEGLVKAVMFLLSRLQQTEERLRELQNLHKVAI